MLYVFLSICCSVVVSVLLKLAKRYQIDVFQAITWNYSMAILLTWIFFKPQLSHLQGAPVYNYLGLGILLPLVFWFIAYSIRITGIVRTDVAQRLSLFIPVIASFVLFSEMLTSLKIIGIALGFIAILCAIPWQQKGHINRVTKFSWFYLLTVFFGMGIIDVLFKEIALFKDVPYTTSLFIVYILAFVIAMAGLLYQVATKKTKFSWPHIFIGWILGVANFGNILFYLKAHQALSNNPSTVFSAMNIGVIAVGTLVGLVIFKEKLSLLNKAGIVIAVVAIIVISYAK
jgi:drug/metabolite transporter (DMT)-like permease